MDLAGSDDSIGSIGRRVALPFGLVGGFFFPLDCDDEDIFDWVLGDCIVVPQIEGSGRIVELSCVDQVPLFDWLF